MVVVDDAVDRVVDLGWPALRQRDLACGGFDDLPGLDAALARRGAAPERRHE